MNRLPAVTQSGVATQSTPEPNAPLRNRPAVANQMSNPLQAPDRHKLIPRIEWNARNVYGDETSLYFRLSRELIGDGKLLVLASNIPPNQPAPNLFFSAVHYLLMKPENYAHPLRQFFPDLTDEPNTLDDPYPVFRKFCLSNYSEMAKLLRTRSVQVNEIGRCSYFLPAFQSLSKQLDGEPFTIIEVGTSAGLNLYWDSYAYDYGDGNLYGNASSEIVLSCELRGSVRPPIECDMPHVLWRFGIDLDPRNVLDDDAMLWLRALIYPEQIDRAHRLEQAIALARHHPPLIHAGNALEVVPRALDAIAPNIPVLLFHSFVLNQFTDHDRAEYFAILKTKSAGRRIFDLALEPSDWPAPMTLTKYHDGVAQDKPLAICDHLGRWMEWLAPSTEF